MIRKTAVVMSLLVLAIGVATGCAKVPTEEIAAADQAMQAATAAEAEVYAPASWSTAQDTRAQLDAEVKAQEESFALSRSYEHARTLAADTKAAAEQAAADAEAMKEKVRVEVAGLIEQAKTSLQETRTLLSNAPQGKGTAADLAALEADARSTEDYLAEADREYQAGNYMEARAKAEAALAELDKVKAEIQGAQKARAGV
jgi:hypothetical protein